MKNFLLIACLTLMMSTDSVSQNAATPNPGFENWTQVLNYWSPNSWNNLNSQTAIIGVFTCTRATAAADVHSGTYAIKLTTKSVFGITANGIASTATLVTTPPYGVTGGIPYTERPDSITGWFKYTPAQAGADSGFVQFVLLGSANDTVGFVKFSTPNVAVGTYTRFSKPITYFSSATPALSYWILSSSDGVNPVVNSSIIIDDLNLVFNPGTAVNEVKDAGLTLISTLVHENLIVNNTSGSEAEIEIIDVSGRLAGRFPVGIGMNTISALPLNTGMYLYRFLKSKTAVTTTGKLIRY